jgi:transposase
MCIIVDESGTVVFEGKAPSDPGAFAQRTRKRAPAVARIGFERSAMARWLWHELKQHDLPVVCVDARDPRDCATTSLRREW